MILWAYSGIMTQFTLKSPTQFPWNIDNGSKPRHVDYSGFTILQAKLAST